VAKDKKGWLEDRRPNANMDPYVVSLCGAAAGHDGRRSPTNPGPRGCDGEAEQSGPHRTGFLAQRADLVRMTPPPVGAGMTSDNGR
jgi:hypothetical protein